MVIDTNVIVFYSVSEATKILEYIKIVFPDVDYFLEIENVALEKRHTAILKTIKFNLSDLERNNDYLLICLRYGSIMNHYNSFKETGEISEDFDRRKSTI